MFITDDLVYLHIPKTGGTFVEHVLRRVYGEESRLYIDTSTPEGKRELGVNHQHQTIDEIPNYCRSRDIVLTARNPYDHYVSIFEFGWWYTHKNTMFNDRKTSSVYPHYPALTFPEFLVAVNNWELRNVHPSRAKVLEFLVAMNNWVLRNVHPSKAKVLADKNVGFVTWQFVRFIAPDPIEAIRAIDCADEQSVFSDALARVACIPTDNLNRGLYDLLVSKGRDPNDVEFILNLGKIYPRKGGRSDGKSWHSYYTPELKAMVREKDRLLFRLFPHFDV